MKNNFLIKTIISGIILRLIYLFFKTGDLNKINLGGDACHHYNIAINVSKFLGPKTDFIFSFWHRHPELPALTDVYLPGFHFFSAIFLLFNQNFITTKLIVFVIFFLNILFTYLICKELKKLEIGLIAIFLICFNFFHIENSTVFTTVNFSSLIVQIFFYVLLLTKKNNNYYYLLGGVTGYASITFGGWQLLFLISIFNILKNEENFKVINIFKLILFFLIFYLTWGIYTQNYFGTFFYSNLKFYPLVENWGDMMNSTNKPEILKLIKEINLYSYFKNHILWFILHLRDLSLFNFPTFVFFLSFLCLPLMIYGSFKINYIGKYLIFFSFGYLIAISLASNSMEGKLWPRHYMPILAVNSILISGALYELIKKNKFLYSLSLKKSYNNLVLLVAFIITTTGIFYKDSFWERNSKPFYNFGLKVQNFVPVDSKILYGLTVQDAWCVTKRSIIMDPVFNQSRDVNRALFEIDYYDIDYLIIDLTNYIYKRDQRTFYEVLNDYKGINLKLIYKDKENPLYLFKILK